MNQKNIDFKLIVLTTLYNCESYISKCIQSLKDQTFKDFTCYLTDDLSTDQTINIVKDLISDDNRFILIQNKEKMYQPGNYDQVIRNNPNIADQEICVEVDGDDWLPDNKVLQRVNDLYKKSYIWLANGSFVYHDGRPGFAQKPSFLKSIRNQDFALTHLRTWRAFLWRKIKIEDLKDQNGKYYEVAGDLAFMFPMFEMAGPIHYRFMKDINYVYNEGNPINDHKLHLDKVAIVVKEIRNKNPYKLLWRK